MTCRCQNANTDKMTLLHDTDTSPTSENNSARLDTKTQLVCD